MGSTSRNLIQIILEATDKTGSKFARAQKNLKGLNQQVKKLSLGFKDLANVQNLVAGSAVGLLVGKIAALGDELDKTSLRTGVSVEDLSRLGFAAELAGADLGAMRSGIRILARRMKDSRDGLVMYTRSFKELGVEVTEDGVKLRNVLDVFLDIADALNKQEDSALRAALASEVLGRQGDLLLPLLRQGSVGIRRMTDESDRLGLTWSTLAASRAAAFVDAVTVLRKSFEAITREMMKNEGYL